MDHHALTDRTLLLFSIVQITYMLDLLNLILYSCPLIVYGNLRVINLTE